MFVRIIYSHHHLTINQSTTYIIYAKNMLTNISLKHATKK
jgi:hypothetical protein